MTSLEEQIRIMKQYAQMMLDRGDYHGLWDAAVDLQRLNDKLDVNQNPIKKPVEPILFKCSKCGGAFEGMSLFDKHKCK